MEIYRLFHFQLLLFINPYSLEPPFRKILNNALKHEDKDYQCPILSTDCPFSNKQFIKRIKLGKQEHKEFMDEMMESVISDLSKPLDTGYSAESSKQHKKEGILIHIYSYCFF